MPGDPKDSLEKLKRLVALWRGSKRGQAPNIKEVTETASAEAREHKTVPSQKKSRRDDCV
jgi:hypothetical protein